LKNYRQKIYSSYYTSHTKHLYGETSIEKIKKQLPVYEYYFGKHLPENKSSSIIDLGCGNGSFVYWLMSKGFNNTIGIDISEELIDLGKALGINNIQCQDIFNYLTDNQSSFDIIVMRDILEHFDKDETYKLIKLLYNHLSENGKIILQVPNGQSPFVGKILFGDFTHQNAFTESSVSQLFKSNGFSDVKVFEVTPIPKNFKGAARFVLWKLLRICLNFLQIIATGDGNGYLSPNIIAVVKK
jgi:2-polyprenyl-3-methyl-5-hydroxy-6-metoxy-1,4-benzoquinol methylase